MSSIGQGSFSGNAAAAVRSAGWRGRPATADPDCVRAQVRRILDSPEFDATARLRAFLAYIVEEMLAGRADHIKAFTVATDVFGRDGSFDPRSDPIVRVEAGHLRRALERYYLTAGAKDPIVILVPKGGYAPVLALRSLVPAEARGRVPASWRVAALAASGALAGVVLFASMSMWLGTGLRSPALELPRLVVLPFDDLTQRENSRAIAQGLTQEVIGRIAKFKDISVVEARTDAAVGMQTEPARYALIGSVSVADDQFRLQVRVLKVADGTVLWANTYEGDLRASQVIEIEATIASQIASTLAQPYGVVFQADASREASTTPNDWDAYACTLSYYAYRANLDAETHAAIRRCLEAAVSRYPSYATAWALLSQTYVDEWRFHYPTDSSSEPASIERALAAARRAAELDPDNIRALQAEMLALYFQGEPAAALEVGRRALAINPDDTELAGEYGFRVAMAGDWSTGCALLEQARGRNPGPLAYFEAALALCEYFRGDQSKATMWIKRTTMPENPNYHVIAAAIYAEAGLPDDAAVERDWIMAHAPALVTNIRPELAKRFLRPQDQDRLIQSLRKAGLAMPAS